MEKSQTEELILMRLLPTEQLFKEVFLEEKQMRQLKEFS
jgi:hypothetical protein